MPTITTPNSKTNTHKDFVIDITVSPIQAFGINIHSFSLQLNYFYSFAISYYLLMMSYIFGYFYKHQNLQFSSTSFSFQHVQTKIKRF